MDKSSNMKGKFVVLSAALFYYSDMSGTGHCLLCYVYFTLQNRM